MPRRVAILSVLSLAGALVVATGGVASAVSGSGGAGARTNAVTSSSLGTYSPTFAGPAATGCASRCHLLTGPSATPSTASLSSTRARSGSATLSDTPKALSQSRVPRRAASGPRIPAVNCLPLGPGCDTISSSSGGAVGVKGLNAVDSANSVPTQKFRDIEPPDQGLCAGNGYVVEDNNIGEILIFNKALKRVSRVIPLDSLMGLTKRGWSSGGDTSCLYDYANGGHWIFTEFVSVSPESQGGAFVGCFAAVAKSCLEGIAVTKGSNPFGPYNVYFLHADYNPAEPGYPYLLNDFVKIATTRDAFLLFYDEFPLLGHGIGGGFFNGAQEFAFDKNALEQGRPVSESDGKPNPAFTVAIENMGLLPTPNGTCARDNKYHEPGETCWFSVIPAMPPDPSQYDNTHGGSGFMLATLDFYGLGGNRLAVFDWTGLGNLNSSGCSACGGIHFGGQLFSGVSGYYGEGVPAAQKAGPIPLGNECGKAKLSGGKPPVAHCPEGGIATNSDQLFQASQAQGQLWAAVDTEIDQASAVVPELHQGAVYWVVGTDNFDRTGRLALTSQGYVSPAHEDIEFPAIAAEGTSEGGNGGAIMSFTLSGNGGPGAADNGGFYPSSAYGRLTSTSGRLLGSVVHIADLGQSPQDGFTEYQGYPGATRPRWGDYGNAIFLPGSGGRILLRLRVHPVPELSAAQVHPHHRHLRRDEGRPGELGDVSQLCRSVTMGGRSAEARVVHGSGSDFAARHGRAVVLRGRLGQRVRPRLSRPPWR